MQEGPDNAAPLQIDQQGHIAILTLNRPKKSNAINGTLLEALEHFFTKPPKDIHAAVLTGAGAHFCGGLDLSEHQNRSPEEAMQFSRHWHRVTDLIEFGPLPVVAALKGAVIGGGLEIASAAHVRVADQSVRFQLPEGRRGIFVGGGATVRVGRIMGADRMREMMLTGRSYDATQGVSLGLAHYVAEDAMTLAQELAETIAQNAPFSNYLMLQGISRITEMSRADGLFTESLATAMAQTSEGAQEGLRAFLEKRAPKFR